MNIQMSINYAIRIINYLHKQEGTLKTGVEISKSVSMPYRRFNMVASQLSKKGIIKSVRGKSGGRYLAKPIDQINIVSIYLALQNDMQTNRCFQKQQHCTVENIGSCHKLGTICSLRASLIGNMPQEIKEELLGSNNAEEYLKQRIPAGFLQE